MKALRFGPVTRKVASMRLATERALRNWEAETGESAAALELFRRISESGEFTASAAHEAFAGIKRKR